MISTCNYPQTLCWKKPHCVSVCLPEAHWINVPSWLNYTMTLNETVSIIWVAFQQALPLLLCFSHLCCISSYVHFSTFSISFSRRLFSSSQCLLFTFTSLISVFVLTSTYLFLFVYSEQLKRKIQYLTHKNSYKPILFSKKKNTTIILTVESLQGYILLSVHSSVTSPFCLFLQEGLSF